MSGLPELIARETMSLRASFAKQSRMSDLQGLIAQETARKKGCSGRSPDRAPLSVASLYARLCVLTIETIIQDHRGRLTDPLGGVECEQAINEARHSSSYRSC